MKKNIGFLELIETKTILIPQIQRDYAQGRTDQKTTEIRTSFLDELFESLINENAKSIVLDFVYGSTLADENVFIPLDGQQRLTTLFVLHWFLCPEKDITVFQQKNNGLISSKFTYETRISSKDFCNALVQHSSAELVRCLECLKNKTDQEYLLSDAIKNESWFLWSWHYDPTINGMLVMLDDIAQRVEDKTILWERLFNQKKITFHMLYLEEFNLSSELYVKMNARGKELSEFDVLKSSLEEQMMRSGVSTALQEGWTSCVDNKWMDLFWNQVAINHLNSTQEIDNAVVSNVEISYQRFISRMLFFNLCLIDEFNNPDKLDHTKFPLGIKSVQDYAAKNDILILMPQLAKCGFFNESLFEFIDKAMNRLVSKNADTVFALSDLVKVELWSPDITSNNILDVFIKRNIIYAERALFFAFLQFAKYYSIEEVNGDAKLENELNAWMRICRNLIQNSSFDTSEDLQNILKELVILAQAIYDRDDFKKSVLFYFSNEGAVHRFNGEQIAEEREKARKILSTDVELEQKIYEMENYAFFKGSIRFLFTAGDGTHDWSLFNSRSEKAKLYFDDNGVTPEYRQNSKLICTLISLFDSWEQCYGSNKIRIGNGVEVWGYILRNRNLLSALSALFDLEQIPSSTEGFTSKIDPSTFNEGYETREELAHKDMCHNGLISEAIAVMGEGILLNWRYEQYALFKPNANADWKKYVVGNRRNEVFFDLFDRKIIPSLKDRNLCGYPYFWGWDLYFDYNGEYYCWNTRERLALYNAGEDAYIDIKKVYLDDVESYLLAH